MDLPWRIALTLGFSLGTVSPAILIPAVVALHEQGYGVAKSIPTICVASAGFNDIFGITIFRIFFEIAFQEVGSADGKSSFSLSHFILEVAAQLSLGLFSAFLLGKAMRPFKKASSK